ncbi:hypothetical protein QUB26_08275, partial [Microcoleus sp. B4-C1]
TGILPVEFVEQASCLLNLWNRHLACACLWNRHLACACLWNRHLACACLWNRHLACFSINSRSPRKGKL